MIPEGTRGEKKEEKKKKEGRKRRKKGEERRGYNAVRGVAELSMAQNLLLFFSLFQYFRSSR
jgi:hypothetical protein